MNILKLQIKVWWSDLVLRFGAAKFAWQNATTMVNDVRRYRKLRDLMTRNLPATWDRVEKIAAVGCWMSWDEFELMLDKTDPDSLADKGYDWFFEGDLTRDQILSGKIKAHEPLKLDW